jgi:RNA polymerase sigma factor (sigma-70 family)
MSTRTMHTTRPTPARYTNHSQTAHPTGPETGVVRHAGQGQGDEVEPDDEAIIRASVAQPELFETIFRRHHRRIWGYLARSGGRDQADELAGDVFVAAFSRRDRYDGRGSVVSWLYAIATNMARTRFRKHERGARALARVAGQGTPSGSPFDDAEAALDGQQALARVQAAMAALPDRDRELITLVAWEGLTYQEVADVLGMELGTVRSRLSRARHRLRGLAGLAGLGAEPTGAPHHAKETTDG